MTYTQTERVNLTDKDELRQYHRTRFLIYGACWLAGALITGLSGLVGLLMIWIFGETIGPWLAFICVGIGILTVIYCFIAGVWHLIQWLNARGD
ncbi:MAG: hypothetical protein GBAus27B_000538 [Mycoplasmataceae bacterium]|nr:MAG: hypothetical protein GBAus27B_000538 [Mycoplasmataceae bacterium]